MMTESGGGLGFQRFRRRWIRYERDDERTAYRRHHPNVWFRRWASFCSGAHT